MYYQAIATDYDGTIATAGQVSATTMVALKRWQKTGRKLILVTGRQLDDLYTVFPDANCFDCIVAENGALVFFPTTQEQKLLGSTPPDSLIKALQQRQVEPFSIGQGIVSTRIPHHETVAQIIQELGIPWQISLNKGAVMLLLEGVDKNLGLKTALERMNLDSAQIVGVGDGENDLPLLNLCGLSVAVGDAVPVLKESSDWVMNQSSGDGVIELIDRLLQ
ncbi:MAG TPA: HAD family hydrolase [Xenococcaceae cyanobacterium]